jgi:hypothetical protein
MIPTLNEEDFNTIQINWFGETAIGSPIEKHQMRNKLAATRVVIDRQSRTKMLSEACSVSNYFGYQKFIGKGTPCAHHMGSTARSYSMDLLFHSQQDDKELRDFMVFKETSDEIMRSVERFDRVTGWMIRSPVTKLLGFIRRDKDNSLQETIGEGVFVPLNVNIETSNEPFLKGARVDFLENNIDFFRRQEIVLSEGGTDYDGLKKYFRFRVADKEKIFRDRLIQSKDSFQRITDGEFVDEYEAFRVFWPIVTGVFEFDRTETLGVLNIDSLRAAILNYHLVNHDDNLTIALSGSKLATGSIVIGDEAISFFRRLIENVRPLVQLVGGVDPFTDDTQRVYSILDQFVRSGNLILLDGLADHLGGEKEVDDFLTDIVNKLFASFFGDREKLVDTTSEAGTVLRRLSGVPGAFNPRFLDSLFTVLVKRKNPPGHLSNTYSPSGLHSGFMKLITSYLTSIDTDPTDFWRDDPPTGLDKRFKVAVYQDIPLPTYEELYGEDSWEAFAPTFDDLGRINNLDTKTPHGEEQDWQAMPAVESDDTVDPSVWFFRKRHKPGFGKLKDALSTNAPVGVAAGHEMSLSIPFDTQDLGDVQHIVDRINARRGESNPYVDGLRRTLTKIIREALYKHRRNNREEFERDMFTLSVLASEEYREKFLGPEGEGLTLYWHHQGNWALPRRLTAPGLGGEIYRVANELQLLEPNERLPHLDVDAEYRSASEESATFVRHLDDHAKAAMKSSMDQVPDDFNSPQKFFPAAKVYLIDFRGNDIVADDSFFSVNPVLSIDITTDKDDPALAVIKLADPLYSMQTDYFDKDNVVSIKPGNSRYRSSDDLNQDREISSGQRRVLGSLRGNDLDGYLKRFKIAQGRPVQIRMGYTAMAYNLPVVFTGRITEIVPGDVLTIVCQGWKAEFVNRQVNFYNDNPKNWGARDLAIQAIQYANPDGFGDKFSQRDADFILSLLPDLDAQDMLDNALRNKQGIDVEGVGGRTISAGIVNSIATWFGFASTDKRNIGLDTRLKNIWWPDVPTYNNILGIRSKLGLLPSFMNDSWVIPMQPAWDVLKEASRHAWNCIVQVVPYDAHATIFMGHPDQPYFYTRGTSVAKSRWRKYSDKLNRENMEALRKLLPRFKESSAYNSQTTEHNLNLYTLALQRYIASRAKEEVNFRHPFFEKTFTTISPESISEFLSNAPFDLLVRPSGLLDEIPSKIHFLGTLTEFDASFESAVHIIRKGGAVANRWIGSSDYPLEAYRNLKSKFGSQIGPLLLQAVYNIDRKSIVYRWRSWERDLEFLLSKESSLDEATTNRILSGKVRLVEANDIPSILNKIKDATPELSEIESVFARLTLGQRIGVGEGIGRIQEDMAVSREEALRLVQASARADPELRIKIGQLKRLIVEFNSFIDRQSGGATNEIRDTYLEYMINARLYIDEIEELLDLQTLEDPEGLFRYGSGESFADNIQNSIQVFRAFVYFFWRFSQEDPEARGAATKSNKNLERLPPNMKVFRVHHYIDSDHDILQNKIVASTAEMWNTVVVEHPGKGEAEDIVESAGQVFKFGSFNSGAAWNYYPKQEITGVVGLQFHPGLTLANKKVKICTELNCQSEELAAKLACTHLADGIRKMYRGTLVLRGRNIKPHDRIVLNDRYTKMLGPIEVESVVHHWNPDDGWVTNIVPQAVCDANPGAAIIQTAILEQTYGTVFSTIDFVSDAVLLGTIIATLGGATPLAAGRFGLTKGLKGIVSNIKQKGAIDAAKFAFTRNLRRFNVVARRVFREYKNPMEALKVLGRTAGGPGKTMLNNFVFRTLADGATHSAFRLQVISGFVEAADKVEQLPIILSPLVYNGVPWTAGMETDDAIYSIFMNDAFYSFRELQATAEKFWDTVFGEAEIVR